MERAKVGGVEFAYETAGDPGGRKVVIIHGLTASMQSGAGRRPGWRGQVADLGGGQSRAWWSSAPEDPGRLWRGQCRRPAARSGRSSGFAPAVLIGHSWGDPIAEEYAIRHPGDVSALVLVDSAGGGGAPRSIRRAAMEMQAQPRREQDIALTQGMGALWDLHQEHGLWGSVAGLPAQTQAQLRAKFCSHLRPAEAGLSVQQPLAGRAAQHPGGPGAADGEDAGDLRRTRGRPNDPDFPRTGGDHSWRAAGDHRRGRAQPAPGKLAALQRRTAGLHGSGLRGARFEQRFGSQQAWSEVAGSGG